MKDVDETSRTALDDIWKLLARRFGQTNEPRDAQRRFHNRHQLDNETIPEYESTLRSLYREAWPKATPEQRDADLKRHFEEGLSHPTVGYTCNFMHPMLILPPLFLRPAHTLKLTRVPSPKSLYVSLRHRLTTPHPLFRRTIHPLCSPYCKVSGMSSRSTSHLPLSN